MSQHHNIIDELNPEELSPEYVRRRIDDWLERLENLFAEIKLWAKNNDWSAEEGAPAPLLDGLAERAGAGKFQQPTLSVRSPEGAIVWIKPKGLWVIGANGRVDIFSPKGAFTLIDVADAFDAPRWILHRVGESEGRSFCPDQVASMV
jgi:hypothetical protein